MARLIIFRLFQITHGDSLMADISPPRDHPKHRAVDGSNRRWKREVSARFASREDCPG